STHIEKVPLILDGDEGTLGTVVLGYLQGLGERAQRLDVPLDAHVAEDEERGANGGLAQRGVAGDEERHAELGLDSVREEVDDLDVDVRDVEVARDAELRLSCMQEAEGALDGLFHRPGHAAGELELAGTVRDGDFDAVQSDGAVGRNARAVYGARSEGISGDEIATALLGHANEL